MSGTSVGVSRRAGDRLLDRAALGGLVADSFGLTATFTFLAGTIVAANLFILFMPKTEPARV